eukprot:CAMPEP_0178938612 /NCGR_PEP_ID=MMETSP0786-20121207/26428_1 /TAXON_ID=186022 /ORGANISM="Thalassionema frauenfeldii, Strain CCMP 1798" /LENGTH=454 /DNA_ID=CAMNT_0020617351 /DNA_START=177 /DNA_END=1541 /DNA_ORIENTATION=+
MVNTAEEKVKRLAKKKSNTVCPNCGSVKKFGFGTICIKFHTFVCNECKSSHQATWTDAEVQELERKGNDYCRRTWLKNAPAEGTGGRPKPGSDISCYKRFVIDAYENKRYYGEDNGAANDEAPPTKPAPIVTAPVRQKKANVVAKAPITAPMPPVADLLDFSAPSTLAQPASQNTSVQSSNLDFFKADFDSNLIENPTTTKTFQPGFEANFDSPLNTKPNSSPMPSTTTQLSNTNLFKADFDSQFRKAPLTGANTFQPSFEANFGSQSNGNPSSNEVKRNATAQASAGLDTTMLSSKGNVPISSDFEGLTLNRGTETAPTSKKPIMGTGRNSNASAISMMGGATQQVNIQVPMQMQMQQQTTGAYYSQQQFQMSQQQQMMAMMNNQNMMSMNMGGVNNGMQSFGVNSIHSNIPNAGHGNHNNLMFSPMFSQQQASQNQGSKKNNDAFMGLGNTS